MGKVILITIGILLVLFFLLAEHHANGRTQKFSAVQKRKITYGAVLGELNQMDETQMCRVPGVLRKEKQERLKDSWNVTDHDSAIETLTWLRTGGHHASRYERYGGELHQIYTGYDDIYAMCIGSLDWASDNPQHFARQKACVEATHKALIEEFQYTKEELDSIKTLSSWDYGRMVWLARFSFGAGFISPEEAWTYIDAAAELGEPDYRDWRGYFAGYLLGHAIWGEHPEAPNFPQRNRVLAQKLLKDAHSPYFRYNFKAQ